MYDDKDLQRLYDKNYFVKKITNYFLLKYRIAKVGIKRNGGVYTPPFALKILKFPLYNESGSMRLRRSDRRNRFLQTRV